MEFVYFVYTILSARSRAIIHPAARYTKSSKNITQQQQTVYRMIYGTFLRAEIYKKL